MAVDENGAPGAATGKHPWNPLAIFVLAMVPWAIIGIPFGIILSTVLVAINWGRFGEPSRRFPTIALGLIGLTLPVALLGWGPKSPDQVHHWVVLTQITCLTVPFYNLHSQREAFLKHVQEGGARADLSPAWLLNVPLGVLATFFWATVNFARPS